MRPQLYNILHSVFLCVLIIGCGSPTEEIGRSSSELLAAITKGEIDAVKEFLKNGTDANVKVKGTKETPLHFAAAKNRWKIVELLISNGADVNEPNQLGDTPLHNAVIEGDKEIVELLIASGADVNAKSEIGSCLHVAVMSSSREVVELLISKGADLNAKDISGGTPLHVATIMREQEIAELLRKNGAKE
jgi:ankyrin repeat protein